MRRVFALAAAAAWSAACNPAVEPVVPQVDTAAVRAPAPREPEKDQAAVAAAERLALFDELVGQVRALHQFSPNTWENLAPLTFAGAVGRLRDMFGSAVTEVELLAALARFGNSLHDAHGGFVPAPPYRAHLTLPVVLMPSWDGDTLSIVVTESRARGVEPGDVVTSYAGTPASAFVRAYADCSSANQWHGIALGVAEWMTERPADGGDGVDGGTVTMGIRKNGGPESFVNLTWSSGGWHGENAADLDAPQYARLRCAPPLPERRYPTYELVSHSATYCLYASKSPRYAPYPILRFFSFDFGRPFDAEAEYDHLVRALHDVARDRPPRGLVLDLRDNVGGNDPNWVLDWFAPRSYLDLKTQVRKTPRIDRVVLEDVANLDAGWVDALVHAPDGAIVSRFLGCHGTDCSDTRRQVQHRILPVPVALLVGPRCNSACDHFARVWEENGLGPLVGEPTGAALSVLRLDYPVVLASGKKLGAMRLAISLDYSPFTGLPVEGLPLHVDVPLAWTWEKRDTYDASMVDAAIASLGK